MPAATLGRAFEDHTLGLGNMAQRVKVCATKPDDPSLIPRIYTVEGENSLLQVVF